MEIMPTYTIWRVQDFHDLDKRDIIYRKINTTYLFKNSNNDKMYFT